MSTKWCINHINITKNKKVDFWPPAHLNTMCPYGPYSAPISLVLKEKKFFFHHKIFFLTLVFHRRTEGKTEITQCFFILSRFSAFLIWFYMILRLCSWFSHVFSWSICWFSREQDRDLFFLSRLSRLERESKEKNREKPTNRAKKYFFFFFKKNTVFLRCPKLFLFSPCWPKDEFCYI